jgi:hypothetical protein
MDSSRVLFQRNPNGFWQRIEQRYKNNFERQALIAEGRAAANSEVMSESLGHAAVNQQNYLDIGYSESNAQYGAAWIAMAEVPAVQVVKGIQLGIKVSRLLDEDKWWFLRETASEKSARLTEIQYRQMKMLKENTGYNVSPESWFANYPQIGKEHTYITDYEAIAKVLGPVQSNTKIGVNLLFPNQGNISLFKAFKLEYHLGLEYWSLYNRGKGFRFSEVSDISDRSVRIPPSESGNRFFKGPSQGLPGRGPELVIDSIPTRPWPWN